MFRTVWDVIRGLLSGRPRPALTVGRRTAVPDGLRLYAIGDVHGRSDLLDAMARRVDRDLAASRPDRVIAVLLGDMVDRGHDSSGVIERLARGDFPVPFETLRGNHEDLMLRALADPDAMGPWLKTGGLSTVISYGVDPRRATGRGGLRRLHRDLLDILPEAHLRVLRDTRLSLTVGDYFLAHAGARPGVPLDRQAEDDLLWIREECYGSSFDFGKVLVHGHTPRRHPENGPRRINVDTGAFKWGVLSAVVLEGSERRFLSTADADDLRSIDAGRAPSSCGRHEE